MFCNYCRALNSDDSVYCNSCGKTIKRTTERAHTEPVEKEVRVTPLSEHVEQKKNIGPTKLKQIGVYSLLWVLWIGGWFAVAEACESLTHDLLGWQADVAGAFGELLGPSRLDFGHGMPGYSRASKWVSQRNHCCPRLNKRACGQRFGIAWPWLDSSSWRLEW